MRLAAAGALGAAGAAGFAPLAVFPLPIFALAVLIAWWDDARGARRAAALGYAFGLGQFLAGVSWVYVSMHRFGGMAAPLAALATLAFCGYLAIYPALAGAAYARLRCARACLDVPLAAAAWTLAEGVRGWLLTGFPWLSLGHSQVPPSPLAGYAPLVGSPGVSFAAMLVAGCMTVAWRAREQRIWAIGAIASIAALGAGFARVPWTRPAGAPVSVSLLQGNVEQSLKWEPGRLRESLDRYLELARAHPARLVVLPETAIPAAIDQLPDGYLDRLAAAAGAGNDLLLGAVVRDRAGYFNSAVGLSGGRLTRYDKRHLVPFGEFTPPLFSWTLRVLHIPMSDFSAGAPRQRPLALAGERIATNICYEDIFGNEIRAALPEATLLINLSNTAWFGDSAAQPQHLQIAQMRALETGRYVLRATNTGMTAAIGPQGRVLAALPPFTVGALQTSVRGHRGATPYVSGGDVPLLALCALAVAAAALRRARIGRGESK